MLTSTFTLLATMLSRELEGVGEADTEDVPLLLPVALAVMELDGEGDDDDVWGGVPVPLLEAPTVRLEEPDDVEEAEEVALVELVSVIVEVYVNAVEGVDTAELASPVLD